MGRIVILTGNHLCHNPRVMKEAETLSGAAHDVEVLGAWFDPKLTARDHELLKNSTWRFTAVVDATASGSRSPSQWRWMRWRRGIAARAHRLFGWETTAQLGYATRQLLAVARSRPSDLFIAHSEPALWAADQLHREGATIGVDMEDWFSEDLLPAARRGRPVGLLKRLESDVLRESSHRTSPSRAMSHALGAQFGLPVPIAIYNAFPWSDRASIDHQYIDRTRSDCPSIHWYSQSLGPGRGLEDLLAALPYLRANCEVHLRGNMVNDGLWLRSAIPDLWRDRVFTHDVVANGELLSRIAEHDIGFAGEQKFCLSRDLTVTNKILHYLLGGLAVVASDTVGQREIARAAPGAIFVYRSGDPEALAAEINRLIGSPELLLAAKAAALSAAKARFCWELEAPRLIAAIEAALARRNDRVTA